MRRLMWFAIGFAAGCGLCAYGLTSGWMIPAFFALLGAFALSLLLRERGKWIRVMGVLALGCALSLGWFRLYHQNYLSQAIALDGEKMAISITLTDYGVKTEYGTRADGILMLEEKPYQVRIFLEEAMEKAPGDRLEGTFRFRVTADDKSYHAGKGIFLIAYPEGELTVDPAGELPRWAFPAKLRRQILTILETCLPEDTAPFAKALLLGDTSELSYEVDTHLKLSGIRHVAAVSGLHISILFTLVTAISFRKRFPMALLGIPTLMLFAALAGFSPSVVRACVMSALMLLALLLNREYDGLSALSFAAFAMLFANPLMVTSISFQLSAASVAGIFLFQEGIRGWLMSFFAGDPGRGLRARLISGLLSTVAVTLSSMTLTTPLCAWHFGTVSLVSVVTNLLTLWIISGIFYGLMAVCLLYGLWLTGAKLLASLISCPIRYVLLTAKRMAGLPMSALYTQSIYVVLWLVFCYILLLLFLIRKNRRPGLLGCCACIGLCFALLLSWWEPLGDDSRMTVLDVGQGQAILLQSEGRTYLVDCGGDSDTATADIVAGTLLSQGIRKLDGIILTHYDRDHAGALSNLLTRIPTELLLLPDTVNVVDYSLKAGTACYVEDAVEIAYGDTKITVYGPIYSGDDNENSMCVLFETENCAILITGDRSAFGERLLLRKTQLPNVDALVAGHHGSADATSRELLEAVKPETVIISVGEGNVYGHPATALLQRLQEFGCSVFRTDLHGTIVYRR